MSSSSPPSRPPRPLQQRQPKRHRSAREIALAGVARETNAVLPAVLAALPHLRPAESEFLDADSGDLPPLEPNECPRLVPARVAVRVVNEDSFNAAIEMAGRVRAAQAQAQQQLQQGSGTGAGTGTGGSTSTSSGSNSAGGGSGSGSANAMADRVAVLNLASDRTPGGGWLNGATAQEEALCYRSSLALSLHRRHYPWRRPAAQGMYTRDVVVVRGAMDQGHALLVPGVPARDLPVFSVLSVAGLRRPEIAAVNVIDTTATATASGGAGSAGTTSAGSGASGSTSGSASGSKKAAAAVGFRRKEVFERVSDRESTKARMRMTLRMAARRGHRLLVLGALGCGAFKNPVEDVAECWLEVLREPEFRGGWWREVWFAVYDRRNEGNFEVFERILGGKEV
ncbi:uncharacterized protein E0L32_003875 [Thyridium curvatum]|uniref:Microbial-type PARG catalytic domain-containing protein n=1 Tax=Thyridium curvatum TaxID=1093900 RepID=A0A507BHW1_9PEZI|nr:uncharacterized protein E0L32_003875 [Thyridium curvatum]TPX16581.1 hypothetical protein E0L32_003875 [Thyridium curvatum]